MGAEKIGEMDRTVSELCYPFQVAGTHDTYRPKASYFEGLPFSKYPGPAGIYNGSPWRISSRAPLIGEHNEEIYCGELALQKTELAYLAEAGVL